jgi:hypothetical protein
MASVSTTSKTQRSKENFQAFKGNE